MPNISDDLFAAPYTIYRSSGALLTLLYIFEPNGLMPPAAQGAEKPLSRRVAL